MLLNTSYSTRPLDLERAAFEPARRDDLDSTSSGESIVPGEEKREAVGLSDGGRSRRNCFN